MSGTGKTPDYCIFDDVIGTHTVPQTEAERKKAVDWYESLKAKIPVFSTPWLPKDTIYCFTDFANPSGWAMAKGVGETPGEETVMSSTYSYEIVAAEKCAEKDGDGKVVVAARAKQLVAYEDRLMVQPTREDLLMRHAKKILDIGAKASEVSVNIRPFCG